MSKIIHDTIGFIQQVISEGKKISFPKKQETLLSVGLVLLIVLICSLFFVLTDFVLYKITRFLLSFGV